MTEHGSFYRKITYLVIIAVLLFPISQLGAPATTEEEGGRLARLRAEHDLGQSNLGEIDPASETIRLATLGLRGVAVSMLWSKANEYKKKEDWTNFRATLSQLTKLQPYFIKVWQYQGWNLSYNVSVELDDVRDRFYYVKRGIEFLKQGIKYNRNSPYLLSELGWFIGNKIGRADEQKDYRRLFKEDVDFHPSDRPPEKRDNWLVSREWYETAVSAVDDKKKSLGKKNPTTFYAAPVMSQINYGEAIENEGVFGAKAKSAWGAAAKLWSDFGKREMKSSLGVKIRLGDEDRLIKEVEELQKEMEEISKTAREEVYAIKLAGLSDKERAILDMSEEERDEEERIIYYDVKRELEVGPKDIAEHVIEKMPARAGEVRRLVNKITATQRRLRLTKSNKDVVNYDYWKIRCELEQAAATLKARELAHSAQKVFKNDADLIEARRLYEESFAEWAKALEEFSELPLDSTTGSDIMEYVEQYARVLEQLDLSLADEEVLKNFPLWNVLEVNNVQGRYSEGIQKSRELKQETAE